MQPAFSHRKLSEPEVLDFIAKVIAFQDCTLTEPDIRALEEELLSSEEKRRLFAEAQTRALSIWEVLRRQAQRRHIFEVTADTQEKEIASLPLPVPVAPPLSPGPRPVWLMVLVSVILIGIIAGVTLQRKRMEGAAVAKIIRVENPRWLGRAPLINAGLESGVLRLESGSVEIKLSDGTQIIMKGPANLMLVSGSECFCVAGDFTFMIPASAKGLRIGTPLGVFVPGEGEVNLRLDAESGAVAISNDRMTE